MVAIKKLSSLSCAIAVALGTQVVSAQEADISRAEIEAIIQRLNALEAENAELRAAISEDKAMEVEPKAKTYTNSVVGGSAANTLVDVSPEYSYNMLNHTARTNSKQQYQLQAQRSGMLDSTLTIGGQVTALADYQTANEDSKFGWLMRHPTSANQIGKNASEAVIHSAKISLTARVTDDISSYVELFYNPEQNFASGSTITGLPRNNVNVRRAYVLWGNLDKTPLYASIGKMDIPFGWNDTVSPFTNSTNWHSFAGLAYGGLVGYSTDTLHLRAMAIQGGAQFRNANTPVGDTNVPSKLNNFAVDANYTAALDNNATLNIGASYQYGTAYCQEYVDTPATAHSTPFVIPGVTVNTAPQGVVHFNPCQDNNDAAAVYAIYKNDRLMLTAEYAQTLEAWPGTHNPYIPQFDAAKNKTFTVGGKYAADFGLTNNVDLSVEFSRYKAGAAGSPWEKQDQLVFGSSYFLTPSVNLFSEAIFVKGWVPLNFLSGGNPGSAVGTSWSSQSSKNQILAVGIKAGI
ncbi:MAG: hypothetical protein R3332_01195 [Pseudohongiellaceae bacterium]|nr:hypothetical protein [Pseudohongiellaceae bacterium]